MASTNNNSLFILLFALIITASCAPSTTTARPLSDPPVSTGLSLAARLKLEGGTDNEPSKCWESLFELQACSGEVIMFFLNGETYLGAGCCQAIRVIGHECWPNIIGTLGFTSEEGDILQGYCDDDHEDSPPLPPSLESKKELDP